MAEQFPESPIGGSSGTFVEMSSAVSQLLNRLHTGDESALQDLVDILYAELHRIASVHLRGERHWHTLQATALVHEAYLKLVVGAERSFADRVHFLSVASRVMRQVLVDYARARGAKKRDPNDGRSADSAEGGLTLAIQPQAGAEATELLDLDRALQALAEEDESLAQLIELRYFGGMTAEETAELLGVSVHVVRHDLRLAQAWLRRKLSS